MASQCPFFDGQNNPHEIGVELYSDVSLNKHDRTEFVSQRVEAVVLKLSMKIWARSSSDPYAILEGDLPVYEGWWTRNSVPIDQKRGLDCQTCYQIFYPA